MNGSPPRMPKKALPCRFASVMVRFSVPRSMASFSSTSTQQPWQRRLQELIMERYRNGGKYSPRLMRRLNFSTDNVPFTPKFQANFHRQRLSVVRRIRVARAGSMGSAAGRFEAGNGGAFVDALQRNLHTNAKKFED